MIQIPDSLKFEENFENQAIKGLKQVNMHGVSARFSEEITDQKVQVMFENNGNLDEAILQVGNFRKFTAYQGEITFIVSTNRATIRNHPEKLAKIRYMMLPENEFLEHENYQILETRETSASTEISEELNSDITILSFSVKFILKG
jgi:hypothetical protein